MPHMSALKEALQLNASQSMPLKPIQPSQQLQTHTFAHLITIKDFQAVPQSNHHGAEDHVMPTLPGLNVSNKEDHTVATVIQLMESDFILYLIHFVNQI